MHPSETEYRIIAKPHEYRPLHKMAEEMGEEIKTGLSWPTIAAYRDGEPIGFISSFRSNGMLCAGPLIINVDGHKIFVARRLVEVYEKLLSLAHLNYYIFCIDKGKKKWTNVIRDLFAAEPYSEEGGYSWFKRDVPHG